MVLGCRTFWAPRPIFPPLPPNLLWISFSHDFVTFPLELVFLRPCIAPVVMVDLGRPLVLSRSWRSLVLIFTWLKVAPSWYWAPPPFKSRSPVLSGLFSSDLTKRGPPFRPFGGSGFGPPPLNGLHLQVRAFLGRFLLFCLPAGGSRFFLLTSGFFGCCAVPPFFLNYVRALDPSFISPGCFRRFCRSSIFFVLRSLFYALTRGPLPDVFFLIHLGAEGSPALPTAEKFAGTLCVWRCPPIPQFFLFLVILLKKFGLGLFFLFFVSGPTSLSLTVGAPLTGLLYYPPLLCSPVL